ncbi:MAG: hypothetical protein LBI45_06760 [Bacteroidales bacterium]|jgi:hypothetical protein|nr:hypothetical protein [Bacteroidales bacterium]
MRYLVINSIFLLFFASCTLSKPLVSKEKQTPLFWTQELRDDTQRNDFRITISTPTANITGIFMVKKIEGKWKGSIINEFGIKVLDFETTAKKCKLLNVLSFIDKWYIKNTFASDIQFIMEIDNPNFSFGSKAIKSFTNNILTINYKNKKEFRRFSNEKIEFINLKYSLIYTFTKIDTNNKILTN